MIKVLIFIIIMGAVVGIFWHDEVGNWLSKGQQQVEEQAPTLINQGLERSKQWWEAEGKEWADGLVANLTMQGKQKINQWLEEQGLNSYGDPQDTEYTEGNPLYDKLTGEITDRYSYVLQKFPELYQNLNLEQYLK